VEEDKDQAVIFIAELSSVYRYLLQSNERELTTLQSELDFIKAYFFLLRTRFRQGVDLQVDVPEAMKERLLPPLTLQILVENAVKHNVISSYRPLLVQITAGPDGWLHVVNNLQRKIQQVPGSRLGLVNITEKFKLLKQSEPRISETITEFRVSIPLMDSRMPYRPFAGSPEKAGLVS
jgi:LytS/YehU family sensor histidine kinase